MEKETLRVDSDTALALRIYEPPGGAHASLVIGAAMGVRQDFYAAFATWLAGQGYRVTTFDYRGHGYSLQGPMRAVRATISDWVLDYEAVVAAAKAALPGQPLYLVGHSLGAQLPGLMSDTDHIAGMLGVAAGSGYWRDNAPRLKRMVPVFWGLIVPVSTALCGYFPGKRLGMVGDLPAGVIRQWRRWCLNPHYGMGAEGPLAEQSYAAVRFPILSYALADDELMTQRGIEHLASFYRQAAARVETIAPHEAGAGRIGHFGFFRPQFEATLWPRAASALAGFERARS